MAITGTELMAIQAGASLLSGIFGGKRRRRAQREAKAAKTYLGNVKVVWTNGTNVATAPREDAPAPPPQAAPAAADDDLPF